MEPMEPWLNPPLDGEVLHLASVAIMDNNYVYVTNRDFAFFYSWCGTVCVKQGIYMYTTSGQFVTFLGNTGRREGKFLRPCCITTCANGFIYVCDGVMNEFRFSDFFCLSILLSLTVYLV